MMSDSFMIMRSSPSSFTSVPDHLPNSTRSPVLTSSGCSLPSLSRAPEPTATTSPSIGFSCAVSGMKMPPAVFASGSTRRIRTRSCNGRSFIDGLLGPGYVGDDLALSHHECQQISGDMGPPNGEYNQKLDKFDKLLELFSSSNKYWIFNARQQILKPL